MIGGPGPTFPKKRHSATFRPIALKLIERGVNILEPAFYYIVSERSDKNWLSAIFCEWYIKTQLLRYVSSDMAGRKTSVKSSHFALHCFGCYFLIFLLNLGK